MPPLVYTDIILETVRAIIITMIVGYFFSLNRRKSLRNHRGWTYLLLGFFLIFLGSLIDITDNFPQLSRYIIIGKTDVESFLEKVVFYLGGYLCLAVGFLKWLPSIAEVISAKEKLQKTFIF